MRLLSLTLLVLAGCDSGAPKCRGSLSGSVTETITGCRVTWDEKSGVADVGNDGILVVSDPTLIDDSNNFGFLFTVDGDARTGTFSYDNMSTAAAGVFVYVPGGSNKYVANFTAMPMGPPTLGSLAVTLTSVSMDFSNAGETQWVVHGSLTATLVPPPPSTATDSVQMTLDF